MNTSLGPLRRVAADASASLLGFSGEGERLAEVNGRCESRLDLFVPAMGKGVGLGNSSESDGGAELFLQIENQSLAIDLRWRDRYDLIDWS